MPITINFDEMAPRELLEDGWYPATIRTAPTTGKSSNKKTPYIRLVWTLDDDETKSFQDDYYLTPKALFRIQTTMIRIGFPANEVEGEISIEPEEFVGKGGLIHLEVHDYQDRNGKQQQINRVTDVAEPGSMADVSDLEDPEIP